MMARLIGIIGKTHGVRFNASADKQSNRIASGPRPSNAPWRGSDSVAMNFRNSDSLR